MPGNQRATLLWPVKTSSRHAPEGVLEMGQIAQALNFREQDPATLPFYGDDTTIGCESELQTAVIGGKDDVDLPLTLAHSAFVADLQRRAAYDPAPHKLLNEIHAYLDDNPRQVWENSWVRVHLSSLNAQARITLNHDLSFDKRDPQSGPRGDLERFFVKDEGGEELLRIPVSYLLKLALAQWIGAADKTAQRPLIATAKRLMGHFVNDNCSPETLSFHLTRHASQGGKGAARESAKRFLLTHLLLEYANQTFRLHQRGQRVIAWFAPQPPQRQRRLNDAIPDAFYRELFTNPCLSGWDRGEEKDRYMKLCHEVLSRGQLNAVAKLRDAGIITRNLVVMPNTSNLSLSNNGTHASLGSRLMGGLDAAQEKALGDLVIKIFEHFLPLFVDTYSAAPQRIAFDDFHPERLLGFLPHQLDYTHLRMLWRAWKKKSRLRFMGHAFTPAGPRLFDSLTASLLHLRGDFVADFRLLDYLVALAGTERSPALDGKLGNSDRLKRELADLGVFDQRMSFYQLYKLRQRREHGFSGFEGRYYSQFPSLGEDMAQALDLQVLLTALAVRYALSGRFSHRDIPDDCFVESERRQALFSSAIALPVVYVKATGRNHFLRHILGFARGMRPCGKYRGYSKVPLSEFRLALLRAIRHDGADLIEAFGMHETLRDLELRLTQPADHSAHGKLSRAILDEIGEKDPFHADADTFNQATENYYRQTLKRRHLAEGVDFLRQDIASIGGEPSSEEQEQLKRLAGEGSAEPALARIPADADQEPLPEPLLEKLIGLSLLAAHRDHAAAQTEPAPQSLQQSP